MIENKEPEKIRLSNAYQQRQYVKTYQLHHSQIIIKQDDNLLIELYMNISMIRS